MIKITKKHRIGIWGFGVVGKAIATYFLNRGHCVGVMDQKVGTKKEYEDFKHKKILFYQEQESDNFFSLYDFFFISPGINRDNIAIRYATLKNQIISELDFFNFHFNKTIIAITGSIGKTTITHCLSRILSMTQIPTFVGGNIGTATFDILDYQEQVDQALLEVSSFQLNYCKQFAPDLAIWTNFHPNHLDYHSTKKNYFKAKCMILKYQKEHQHALLPFELRNQIPQGKQQRAYFTTNPINAQELRKLNANECLYYIAENQVIRYHNNKNTSLFFLPSIKLFTFLDNILILVGACDILQLNLELLKIIALNITLPEHRLEKIESNFHVHFYNDSKGTTPFSTLAAVEKLTQYPLHLFLGGLSKGVCRGDLINSLRNKVSRIYCFGAEAEELWHMCKNSSIEAEKYSTLTEAFNACTSKIQPGDCVLLSPAGSSFDLYANYQERGNHFKKLVCDFVKRNQQ